MDDFHFTVQHQKSKKKRPYSAADARRNSRVRCPCNSGAMAKFLRTHVVQPKQKQLSFSIQAGGQFKNLFLYQQKNKPRIVVHEIRIR